MFPKYDIVNVKEERKKENIVVFNKGKELGRTSREKL